MACLSFGLYAFGLLQKAIIYRAPSFDTSPHQCLPNSDFENIVHLRGNASAKQGTFEKDAGDVGLARWRRFSKMALSCFFCTSKMDGLPSCIHQRSQVVPLHPITLF